MTPSITGSGSEADFARTQFEAQRTRAQETVRRPEPESAPKVQQEASRDLAHVRGEPAPVRTEQTPLRDDDLATAAAHAARDFLRGEPKVATIVHGRAVAQRAVDVLL